MAREEEGEEWGVRGEECVCVYERERMRGNVFQDQQYGLRIHSDTKSTIKSQCTIFLRTILRWNLPVIKIWTNNPTTIFEVQICFLETKIQY